MRSSCRFQHSLSAAEVTHYRIEGMDLLWILTLEIVRGAGQAEIVFTSEHQDIIGDLCARATVRAELAERRGTLGHFSSLL